MNSLFFTALAAMLVLASCGSVYKRHACINDLLECVEDDRVTAVTNNPYGVSQRQACAAAAFLLECVKVCPRDFLVSSGIQGSIDELAQANKQC